jgi:transposase-like protein
MADFPRSVAELEKRFSDERACADYLGALRWGEGFRCPGCGAREAWATERGPLMCRGCGRQCSVTAGTIFHGARVPLTTWFRAAWWMVAQKQGASAAGLRRSLGLRSSQTAWHLLHRLRRAMVRAERAALAGVVEVDETFVGGYHEGRRGRDLSRKALVVIAVECRGDACGRVRLRRAGDSSARSLGGFVKLTVAKGSRVVTDGLASYSGLASEGYVHEARNQSASTSDEDLLPHAHRVASLLKRWLLGTHQGGVHRDHLDAYLEEFGFRFNRRTSRSPGLLFLRLMENAVRVGPLPYERLVSRRTGRGPKTDHKM